MSPVVTRYATAGALLVAAVIGLGWLQRGNAALRWEIAELRRQNEVSAAARAELERRQAAAPPAGEQGVSAAIPPAGPPANPQPAPTPAPAGAPAAAPAPLTAMLRVEELTNRGRATPADAWQTLIWAAMNGQEDELAACLVFTGAAREKAEAWRAALPAEAQAKYTPLEKLPGLFLTEEITRKAAAMQIMDTTEAGPGQVVVRMRQTTLTGSLSTAKLPMHQTERGWAFPIDEKMIDAVRKSTAKGQPEAGGKAPQP